MAKLKQVKLFEDSVLNETQRVALNYAFKQKHLLNLSLKVGNHRVTNDFSVVTKDTSPFSAFWKEFLKGQLIFPNAISTKPLKVADLFCASGGLSLGVKSAASFLRVPLQFSLGVDLDDRALDIYKYHHVGSQTFAGNIDQLIDFQIKGHGEAAEFSYPPELSQIGKLFQDKYDVVLAGPPCQGHSSMNVRTRYDDPRNKLYLSAVAFAVAVEAKAIIIENVPGVTKDVDGVVFAAKSLLKKSGYFISTEVLSASKFGWPQTRKRYFLIATKLPFQINLSEIKNAALRKPLDLAWAIGDIQNIDRSDVLFETPSLSRENLERVRYLQESNEIDLPLHLRPKSHQNGTTFYTVYGRLEWDKPSGTITTGFLSPGRGRFTHPTSPRALLPAEAARLQGFPDNYFPINNLVPRIRRTELAKWIGDAVPTILGFYAGIVGLFQFMESDAKKK